MGSAEIVIIGAGVVGLAVAAELARDAGRRTVVIMERHEKFGRESSSRNSEVIHAGIYYPTGSLKARLCVEGNALLYDFCRRWDIPHAALGKLIAANSGSGIEALENLLIQARLNGVPGIDLLETSDISRLEPHIRAQAALYSPTSGIIDSHRLMACLERLAVQGGALPAYCHTVTGITHQGGKILVRYNNPDGSADQLECGWLINCAGLSADRVAAMTGIDPDADGYRIFLCKGEYFSISQAKSKLVSRLIYPPPLEELQGLGVHLTSSLDGRARLGPNALYVEEEEYSVNRSICLSFSTRPGNICLFLSL